jgi:hypothetical protein
VPHLLRHEDSVFPVSFEGPPQFFTTHNGLSMIYSNPDPYGCTKAHGINRGLYTVYTHTFLAGRNVIIPVPPYKPDNVAT